MAVEKTLVTAEELLRLPGRGRRYELVKGELRSMPPAGGEHGVVAGEFLGRIREHVRAHRLGLVFAAETGFRLARDPDTVRAPDVAFVAAGRLPGDRPPATFPELAPDLVVEVVSPFDTASEVEEKVLEWLRAGARLVWLAYPSTRTVGVYRALDSIRLLTQDDRLDGEDVLPGFSCPVSELFPD